MRSGGEAYIFAVAMVRAHTNMAITIPMANSAKYEHLDSQSGFEFRTPLT